MLKSFFPFFDNNPDVTYLDSAATSLKLQSVIDAEGEYNTFYSANVHRGLYTLAERATSMYEDTRAKVADYIGAQTVEIVFTKNATEALNILARGYEHLLRPGDEVVGTYMDHHSNMVPWQEVCRRSGATWKMLDLTPQGTLPELSNYITAHTKILTLPHVSNVVGTINPIADIVRLAKSLQPDIVIVVDGAQAVPHMRVDVQELGCDAYVFSGHKLYASTGVGVLWAKKSLLEQLEPLSYGGDMIETVTEEKATWNAIPYKFEAGTPPIAQVIGLGAAINFLNEYLSAELVERKHQLSLQLIAMLQDTFKEHIRILGPIDDKRGNLVAFSLQDCHPHDIAQLLDEKHVCIRAGHHCNEPLHRAMHLPATARISMGIYTTEDDIEKGLFALKHAYQVLTGISV